MLPVILQLAGAILLAVSAFSPLSAYYTVSFPVVGQKPAGLKDALRERVILRSGIVLVAIGYIMQIGNMDFQYLLSLNILTKTIVYVISVSTITGAGWFISIRIADKSFEKAPVFSDETPVPPGTIAIFPD